MSGSKPRKRVREMSLPDFISTCARGQQEAAEKLGCTQGNISQALKDISAGTKTVRVRIHPDGSYEADIIKPFGRKAAA